MEINTPVKDVKTSSIIQLYKAIFFVFILNPQNTLLILEECLSVNVLVIPLT